MKGKILFLMIAVAVLAFTSIFVATLQGANSGLLDIRRWDMFHGDLQNTGYLTEAVNPPLVLLWKRELMGPIYSSPAVKDGILYIGSNPGLVYAINTTTGEIIWSYSIGKVIVMTPFIDDYTVYISSWDNTLYAFNLLNGSLKWIYTSDYPLMEGAHAGFFIYPSPKVFKGIIYIGFADGRMHAINAETGKELWSFPTGTHRHSTVAIYENKIFFGTDNQYGTPKTFYALDAETGEVMWQKTLQSNIISSPAIYDSVVYVGSGEFLYALKATDGSLIWARSLGPRNAIESSPVVTPSTVYICGGDWSVDPPRGALYAIDRSTGYIRWSLGTEFTRITPSVAGNIIYLGNFIEPRKGAGYNITRHFYAVHAETGDILWKYPVNYVTTSIPAIVNGIVYVADGSGTLYAFINELVKAYMDLKREYRNLQVNYDRLKSGYDKLAMDYKELNATYYELRADCDSLNVSYNRLQTSYTSLKADYDSLKVVYDTLKAEHESTTKQLEIKMGELRANTNLMYLFVITTIAFVATTVYFAKRKPKTT